MKGKDERRGLQEYLNGYGEKQRKKEHLWKGQYRLGDQRKVLGFWAFQR